MHGTAEIEVRRHAGHPRREWTSQRVVDALRSHGHASRSDLARSTGLSRTTVASVVADLQEQGLVTAGGSRGTRRKGRPPTLLRLHHTAGAGLALHVDERGVDIALADLSSTVLGERRAGLPSGIDLAGGVETIAAAVDAAVARVGVERLKVHGAILVNARPGWTGPHAAAALAGRLGMPVRAESEVSMAALGELVAGAAQGLSDVVYVSLSERVEAGLVLGGRLHHGSAGLAGRLGHVQVSPEGALCRCGNRGCLETTASVGAVLSLLRAVHGPELGLPELLGLLADGDPGACRVVGDAGRALGRVLAAVCNTLNPQAIIVGGELSAAGEPLFTGIEQTIARYAQAEIASLVDVRRGDLGRRAALRGALNVAIAEPTVTGAMSRVRAGSRAT